jgi:hypothetical protein
MNMTVQQWLNSSATTEFREPFLPAGDIIIGLVRFDAEAKMFRIYKGMRYQDGTYDIHAERIQDGGAFLDFLLQVNSKLWCTAQHIKDLLDCVTCWGYRETGKFPQEYFDVIGDMSKR